MSIVLYVINKLTIKLDGVNFVTAFLIGPSGQPVCLQITSDAILTHFIFIFL